ncbi:hypothetical protein BBUWI9123_F0003 (plasmid) [Borreliella burgdorferi WI91-23]|nr:hypothetical protein BBUWI9123_F0003 [Borreliella burgdorferi WI91-23]
MLFCSLLLPDNSESRLQDINPAINNILKINFLSWLISYILLLKLQFLLQKYFLLINRKILDKL